MLLKSGLLRSKLFQIPGSWRGKNSAFCHLFAHSDDFLHLESMVLCFVSVQAFSYDMKNPDLCFPCDADCCNWLLCCRKKLIQCVCQEELKQHSFLSSPLLSSIIPPILPFSPFLSLSLLLIPSSGAPIFSCCTPLALHPPVTDRVSSPCNDQWHPICLAWDHPPCVHCAFC